jgi:hypothetical protein
LFDQNKWFKEKIINIHEDNTYDIYFKIDGDTQTWVNIKDMRLIHKKHHQQCDKCKEVETEEHIFQECIWTKNIHNILSTKHQLITLKNCWPRITNNDQFLSQQLQICWLLWKCRKEDEHKSNIEHILTKKHIFYIGKKS